MNVLIIFSHPSKKSYTHQVLEHLKNELILKRSAIEVSDLYAINFQSDMTEQEYDREAFSKIDLPLSDDVLQEHKKIKKADCIIFLYPIWWSDCPAKLKGWFDRVFSVGFAYKQTAGSSAMGTLKYGIAICTAGYSNEVLKEMEIAQSMETIMLKDRLGNRFQNKEMIILGDTLNLKLAEQRHLNQIKELADKIEHYCKLV
jgi:NAD(P)H dehydrogenase (quinone)